MAGNAWRCLIQVSEWYKIYTIGEVQRYPRCPQIQGKGRDIYYHIYNVPVLFVQREGQCALLADLSLYDLHELNMDVNMPFIKL